MVPVTWDAVRARRLARQSLLAPAMSSVAVAHDTCGIHAQVMAAAELSLSARVAGIAQQDVRDALWRDRTLVKAWTLRGTLHLHPAGELPLWFAARRAAGSGVPNADEELPPEEVEAVYGAIREALDGRCLLREELAEEVVRRVGPRPRERLLSGWGWFLDETCHGPPQGNRVTFARPDQWIAGWRDVDEDDALRQVLRRFLKTFGPARPQDFAVWVGGRSFKPRVRGLFASLEDELEEVDVEGHRGYVLAGDTEFPGPTSSLKLLPEYDVYMMGFRERDQLVPPDARERLFDHARGKYEGPVGLRWLFVDGVAAGLWERKKRGKRIELRVEPIRRLTRSQRAQLGAEAERIGTFLGLEPVLTLG